MGGNLLIVSVQRIGVIVDGSLCDTFFIGRDIKRLLTQPCVIQQCLVLR